MLFAQKLINAVHKHYRKGTLIFKKRRKLYMMKRGNSQEPQKELANLQQEFWKWFISENPVFATRVNEHTYDDKVDDFSISTFDRWKTAVDKYNQDLSSLQRNTLSEKQKVDYDVFQDFLKTYIEGHNWKDYGALNPLSFLEGPYVDPDYLVRITPKKTLEDFENFISRIQKFPNKFQQMKSRFERAVQLGHTYHSVSIATVPDMIAKTTASTPENFSFYQPFKETLDKISNITDEQKASLRMQAKEAIQKYFDALLDIKLYLETDYFKHLRQGHGVCAWDNGREFYKSALQWHLSLPITPEEVHQIGLDETDRISKQINTVLSRLGYHGSWKEAFNTIKKDSKFFLRTGDEVIAKYKQIIHEEIEPKMHLMFKNLPGLPVEVHPMPIDGCAGLYLTGTPDGSIPGIFQVNTNFPEQRPTLGFMALALHETYPGHHLQLSIQQQANIPEFRRHCLDEKFFQAPLLFPFYNAYLEGWALYAEALGEEMGLYTDDYQLLGRYDSEIFRACRLVVDTGMHYMNWTREEAKQFMVKHTFATEHTIDVEINRYITWPGQACSYKIGELKIKELRNKATNTLGKLFDLKEFHSVVLKHGALPLSVLEKIVDQWIETVKEGK